jgi:ParB family chromosome partitioning protein
MKSIVEMNPFRCRMWELHDRLEAHVTEQTCRDEIESFLAHGQLVPAVGRPVRGDPDFDVELVCGARRLFVARHLNTKLLVELRQMSDREAMIAMDIENRHRADITPYERGRCFARWLRSGHFSSQDEIAQTLKISASQVSRLLKLARLPSAIVGAFDSALDICEGWGLDLVDAIEDPVRKQSTLRKAREISSAKQRPPAREIYKMIMAAGVRGQEVKPRRRDEVITNRRGEPLFRIRHQNSGIALLLPLKSTSSEKLIEVCAAVSEILQQEGDAASISQSTVHAPGTRTAPDPMTWGAA